MLKPQLLLLDEPSLGLSPLLVTEIFRILASLRETGVSILLSEQNARLSLAIADRGYVIETGKIVREGTGAELLASSDIMERYLGVGTSSIDLAHDPLGEDAVVVGHHHGGPPDLQVTVRILQVEQEHGAGRFGLHVLDLLTPRVQ